MRACLLAVLLLSCGGADNQPQDNKSPSQKLLEKYDLYLSESAKSADSYGFVGEHCDSLLFTSLAAHAGLSTNVYQAEKSPGEWQRHPAFDCFPNGASDSTISKDMFMGLLVYLSGKKDVDAASRLLDYGKAHNYFMGSAKDTVTSFSKTLLSLGLIQDFGHLRSLGLTEDDSSVGSGVQEGYLGHLDILHIYARGNLYGGINSSDLALAKAYCEHSPRNALYCAVWHRFSDGDFSGPTAVLMDESLFPANRLPSSTERCTEYLWQREDSPRDWSACDDGKTYQGVDFLIAARVILGAAPKK